jgi:acetyl-CoA carboxylase biotin carboxyl carrier protein
MDAKTIQELIRLVNKSDLTEVEIETPDFRLRLKRGGSEVVQAAPQVVVAAPPAPAASPSPSTPASAPANRPPAATESSEDHLVVIRSPMIGTFYRAPGPDKEPFVKVGDDIDKGQVLCIIEAMKLFNEIESEQRGRIVRILVENAQPVEYDQPLFLIDPS